MTVTRLRLNKMREFIEGCWLESMLLISDFIVVTIAATMYHIPLADYFFLLTGSLGLLFLPFYVSCFVPKE